MTVPPCGQDRAHLLGKILCHMLKIGRVHAIHVVTWLRSPFVTGEGPEGAIQAIPAHGRQLSCHECTPLADVELLASFSQKESTFLYRTCSLVDLLLQFELVLCHPFRLKSYVRIPPHTPLGECTHISTQFHGPNWLRLQTELAELVQ